MILKICPKTLENVLRRAFPRIYESLKGVVKNFWAYAPRPLAAGALDTPLMILKIHMSTKYQEFLKSSHANLGWEHSVLFL